MHRFFKAQHTVTSRIILLTVMGIMLLVLWKLPYFNLIINPTNAFLSLWISASVLFALRARIQFTASFVTLFISLIVLLAGKPASAQQLAVVSYICMGMGVIRTIAENRNTK